MVLNRKIFSAAARVALLSLLLLGTGCISSVQPIKLKAPASVSTVFLMEFPNRPDIEQVPESFAERTEAELSARNMNSQRVAFDSYAKTFRSKRGTEARLAEALKLAPNTPFVALVETRVRFYTYLSGRFRWNVTGRVTFVHNGDLETARTESFEMAAFLQLDSQDEADALAYVEVAIAERIGTAADKFISGLDGVPLNINVKRDSPRGPPEKFAADDSVYFIMLDRFSNGDPANDAAIDPADPQAFHGGDLRGLIQNLDYLQQLGIKTIWLSPVFKMRTTKFHGHGAFHGYWVEDLAALEPRFGTESELVELREALNARGMRVILDLVLNHVGPETSMVTEKPDWFHGHGGITDWNNPKQITDYDVHGLPDLAQEKPEVYDYLVKTSKRWIEILQPAGFRLDAVKHVPNSFWKKYNKEIYAMTSPEFVMLGEQLDGNPASVAQTAEEGEFNAIFDFPLHFAMVEVFCKDANVGKLASVLYADRLYPKSIRADRRGLVTLLDNHDLPRIQSACGGDQGRVRDALNFMMSARGTPSFTWGTEIGLEGATEPENRADMRFDSPESHPMGRAMLEFLKRRAESSAIAGGVDRLIALDDEFFAYVRINVDQAAVIVVNRGAALRKVVLPSEYDLGQLEFESPGNTVEVHLVQAPEPGAFAGAVRRARATLPSLPVKIATETLVTTPGDKVFMAGSGPELGNWSIKGAPSLTQDGSTWAATVSLPARSAFAYKFVIQKPDGTLVWEDGENHFVFVE